MAQIRSSRWWVGLTAVLATAFVAAVYFVGFWEPGSGSASAVGTSPSASASVAPSDAPSGPISAPDEALPLTPDVLEAIGPGWLLTTYNSSSGRYASADERIGGASPAAPSSSSGRTWDNPGTRRILVVDRVGTVYEGADLGISSGLVLRLWLPDGRTVIVAHPQPGDHSRVVLYSFDIITGQLSAPFDGPGAAPSFASLSPSPSPSASPSASPVAQVAPAAPTNSSPVWVGGDVRLASGGDSLLVSDGADQRQWVRLTLDGRAIAQAVPPITAGTLVEDPDGAAYAVSELVTITAQRWDEEILEWVTYARQYWHTVTYAEELTGKGDRVDHGAPPSEDQCDPFSWAPGRQLLETCQREDGTVALYTVAPATNTFVRVAVFPPNPGGTFFSAKPDGTRVATDTAVYTITGEVAWKPPSDEPRPTGFAWSGDVLALWGDAVATNAPGYGEPEIRVHDAFDGRPRFILVARPGEAGFGTVVGRS